MNADQSLTQILHHLAERNRQGGSPADQHIVVVRAQSPCLGSRRKPDDFAQTAPHTISLRGVADLPRDGKADPDRLSLTSGALPRLQHERTPGSAQPLGRSSKIGPALEPLDDGRMAILLTH